ncbi:restriction endonuclease subunit S [Clostridium perfringens]|uniref:restriction endonuclease subunit S n=1 Tax=Clostridium perfringens TaxID=1502 RepID=UPI0035229070
MSDLFEIVGTKSLDSNAIEFINNGINFIGRTDENNGKQGEIELQKFPPNNPYTITATVIGNYKYVKLQKEKYYCSQNINKLTPKKEHITRWNDRIAYYLICNIQKFVSLYNGQQGGYTLDKIKNHIIQLPTKNKKIDFEFMESFVAELEAKNLAELEAYLLATGLKDYELTDKEKQAISNYDNLVWNSYNLQELFGKATRGKRLKSADRIEGDLPFVTAGETNEGISAFIGNKVQVFSKNTITIDMFGSAKYRNYNYGGDDHIAVVHTEKLPMEAAIFVTAAIHKSSHNGQFNYGKNFYAKDADELNIMLPEEKNKPNYEYMETLISAIKKLVIKDVVLYTSMKIEATRQVIYK